MALRIINSASKDQMDQLVARHDNQSLRRSVGLKRALIFMLLNYRESISLEQVSEFAGISKPALCRGFDRVFGMTPMKWLWRFRVHVAAELIKNPMAKCSLTEIAFASGFKSSAHFSRVFTKIMGLGPLTYKRIQPKNMDAYSVNPIDTGIVNSKLEVEKAFMAMTVAPGTDGKPAVSAPLGGISSVVGKAN